MQCRCELDETHHCIAFIVLALNRSMLDPHQARKDSRRVARDERSCASMPVVLSRENRVEVRAQLLPSPKMRLSLRILGRQQVCWSDQINRPYLLSINPSPVYCIVPLLNDICLRLSGFWSRLEIHLPLPGWSSVDSSHRRRAHGTIQYDILCAHSIIGRPVITPCRDTQ